MDVIAAYWFTVLCCFAGWLSIIVYASANATLRRVERGDPRPRVWPWTFVAERPLRCAHTALFAGVGYLGLIEFDLLSPFWAFVAGASSEATAELVRGLMKAGFLRGLVEKRLGMKVPVPDDSAPSLSDTTILQPGERPVRRDEA